MLEISVFILYSFFCFFPIESAFIMWKSLINEVSRPCTYLLDLFPQNIKGSGE